MILENRLNNILNDLSNHKRNKLDLISYYVNIRLNESMISYNKELEDYCSILLNNNNMYLLKRL